MSADDRDNTGSPALNAWLAAAREDLAARETPAWLEFQLRERLAERNALNAVHRARESQSDQTQLAPDRGSRPGARWLNGLRATFTRVPRRWPALAAAATACVALVIGLTVLSPMLPAPRGVIARTAA